MPLPGSSAFVSCVCVPGSVYEAPAGICVSSWYLPLSSAAAATTVLNVDPGGYSSLIARLSIGLLGFVTSSVYALLTEPVSCEASSFGS